jgi:hypothetical protein
MSTINYKKILKAVILSLLAGIQFNFMPNIYASAVDPNDKTINHPEQKITEEELERLFSTCERADVLSKLQKIYNAAKETNDETLSENIYSAAQKTRKVIDCWHPMMERYYSGDDNVKKPEYLDPSKRRSLADIALDYELSNKCGCFDRDGKLKLQISSETFNGKPLDSSVCKEACCSKDTSQTINFDIVSWHYDVNEGSCEAKHQEL